jgi:hypothetical protein
MNVECKRYRIGGHTVEVRLEKPWTFKALNKKQVELVERLRNGEDIGIETVPADRVGQLSVNEEVMGEEAMARGMPRLSRWRSSARAPFFRGSSPFSAFSFITSGMAHQSAKAPKTASRSVMMSAAVAFRRRSSAVIFVSGLLVIMAA